MPGSRTDVDAIVAARSSRVPLVYVAGPISGDPFGCVRQAAAAFRELRALGCVPFLPQLSVLHEMVDPLGHDGWLDYDFEVLLHCQALVRLPGESVGADREVEHAQGLGLPVFFWDTAGRVEFERWRFPVVSVRREPVGV